MCSETIKLLYHQIKYKITPSSELHLTNNHHPQPTDSYEKDAGQKLGKGGNRVSAVQQQVR